MPRDARPPEAAPVKSGSTALRSLKLGALCLLGPPIFAYLSIIAPRVVTGRGGRGHFWRATKRSCSLLLRLLGIRCEMSDAAKSALAEDEDSIIVVNHRSHLDGFTMMDTIPDAKWFTFAAKKELFQSGFLARGFLHAGLVEIDRKNGKLALDTLTDAIRAMPARRSVVLFVEGTRSSGETLGSFKAGAVLAARATGRHIRPIVICGTDTLMPRDAHLPKSGAVRLEVLPTFHCDPSASVEDDLARLRGQMCDVFDGHTTGL